MNLPIKPLALGAAVLGGGYLAFDALRYFTGHAGVDGEGESTGTITGWAIGHTHRGAWALEHALHPSRVKAVMDGAHDAKRAQKHLFRGTGLRGVDDAADAFRHTYGSALITERLIAEHEMSPEDASALVRSAGVANEDDSQLDGHHRDVAREMDTFNNDVGIALGMTAAEHDFTDMKLRRAVLSAIRSGETEIVDPTSQEARASSAADLPI
jgi:hypothetical protein